MTNEKIKTLADGYYAGNADWLNKEQEQDTKVGWRQGFAYALRQFAVSGSLGFNEGYEKGYNDATKEACDEIAKNYQPNDR